jgi:hypothetical protein
LVIGGVNVVRELNFDNWPESERRHADCRRDNASFSDWCIKTPLQSVLSLQPLGCPEHAPKVAHVFTENEDVRVSR